MTKENTVWAVVPLKRASLAKTRLMPVLSEGERQSLFLDMAARVIGALLKAAAVSEVLVVTSDPTVSAFAASRGARSLIQPDDLGTASACAMAMGRLRQIDVRRALVVSGDLPLATAQSFDQLIALHPLFDAVSLVPDRHGTGTNALICAPGTLPMCFGANSFRRHLEAAVARGLPVRNCAIPELSLDIDTPEDLTLWREREAEASMSRVAPAHRLNALQP